MQIGAMNNPHVNLYEELEWIGKNGFDFVDLTIEPECAMPGDINVQRAEKIMKKHGLGIVGHIGDWRLPKDSPYPAIREGCKTEIINAMRVLKKLGAKKISTHAFEVRESDYATAEKMCFALYKDLLKEAKKLRVMLMVENNTYTDSKRGERKLLHKLLKRYDSLKMHVDVGHANIRAKENRIGMYCRMYDRRIQHLHFSDNYGKNDNHLKLGAARISWKKIIKTLKKYKYDGTITLETFRSGRKGTLGSMSKLKKWWEMY
jgi:sugar phosphate isomerase/epimerase